jgi:hypothetical protein
MGVGAIAIAFACGTALSPTDPNERVELLSRRGGQRGTRPLRPAGNCVSRLPVVAGASFSDPAPATRAGTFHCTRLSTFPCFAGEALPIARTIPGPPGTCLSPVVLSQALPRAVGDSGGSLARGLASCRRARLEAGERGVR